METEGSFSCPQKPAIRPYSEPDEFSPLSHKIHFNALLPCKPLSHVTACSGERGTGTELWDCRVASWFHWNL